MTCPEQNNEGPFFYYPSVIRINIKKKKSKSLEHFRYDSKKKGEGNDAITFSKKEKNTITGGLLI